MSNGNSSSNGTEPPRQGWRPTGEHFLRDLRMDVEKPIGFDAIMRVRSSTEFGVIPVHRDTELFAYGGCGPVRHQQGIGDATEVLCSGDIGDATEVLCSGDIGSILA
ncbi:unnamed protein product [Boreogadus saida]